jgi:hypothetical protein
MGKYGFLNSARKSLLRLQMSHEGKLNRSIAVAQEVSAELSNRESYIKCLK